VNDSPTPGKPALSARLRKLPPVPLAVSAAVALVLLLGGALHWRSTSRVSKVALAASPKRVSVVEARAGTYRPAASYVGTIQPWVEARVGPQLVSAYVDTVLVRPGAAVRRGQVLATLDCRNASAESRSVAMQARALEARQEALAHEAARVGGLLQGGYVSPNEAEQKTAESASKEAELLGARAKVLRTSLEVDDCILRAPFDGEVAERMLDPGAFARPGTWAVTVVDRSTVRATADVPELDFAAVAPGVAVQIRSLATGATLAGKISRRSPAADPATRTVHFEVDVPDPSRRLPVHTTAELTIEVGSAVPASEIPLPAATVREAKASVVVVEAGRARRVTVDVRGESLGTLYLDPGGLAPGTLVVTEGRSSLQDGDEVATGAPAAPPRSRQD
jgi:RND family efflux transporter MFP subunit